jgi:hypothetical protein
LAGEGAGPRVSQRTANTNKNAALIPPATLARFLLAAAALAGSAATMNARHRGHRSRPGRTFEPHFAQMIG